MRYNVVRFLVVVGRKIHHMNAFDMMGERNFAAL